MNLHLKENEQWLQEKREKRKKKIKISIICVLVCTFVVTSLLTIKGYRITNGLFFPTPQLQTEKTGEPSMILPKGYVSVLKTPSLPYTITVSNHIDFESETGCIYLKEHYGIALYEVDTTVPTTEVLQKDILPAFGISANERINFYEQQGYFNNRLLTVSADTFYREKQKTHVLSYRVITAGTKDILIAGISNTADFEEIEKEMQNVIYSIREEAETAETLLGDSVYEIHKQEQTLWQEIEPDTEDILPPQDNTEFMEYAAKYVKEINENVQYVESQEYTIKVEEELQDAYFVFQYSNTNIPLSYVYLYEPDGESIHFPDITKQGEYIFHIENPKTGTWTYRFSADSYIGVFHAYAEEKEIYEMSQQN